VEDRGPGLGGPTERARVFERFYRGNSAGRRGAGTGSGLGLALVAEHVRLNGGSVWAEEAEGGGARFVVELPLEDPMDLR
jgi:signal transduction histidine kinase